MKRRALDVRRQLRQARTEREQIRAARAVEKLSRAQKKQASAAQNRPLLANKRPHAVGHAPQRGSWQGVALTAGFPTVVTTSDNTDIRGIIGRNIRQARTISGLSQERLGEMVGVSRKRIGDYEMGRHQPEWPRLVRIAEATGLGHAAWLLVDHREEPP
jgi:DNA-binding XRE family transcriptional regulator